MWRGQGYNSTINVKHNYLISFVEETEENSEVVYISIYDLKDKNIIFKTETKWYLFNIATKDDNVYIVTCNNYLLIFDLNSFEFICERNLSKSGGNWRDENIHHIFPLEDNNYLLFNHTIFIEDDEDSGGKVFFNFILYDIQNNISNIIYQPEENLFEPDLSVFGNNVNFCDNGYNIRAKVNIEKKSLDIMKRVYTGDKTKIGYLIDENDILQLKVYAKTRLVKSSTITIKDYNNNELVVFRTRFLHLIPLFIENKHILILFAFCFDGFYIYTFKKFEDSLKPLKEIYYDDFHICDSSRIIDYTKELGKILLQSNTYNEMSFMVLDLEEII